MQLSGRKAPSRCPPWSKTASAIYRHVLFPRSLPSCLQALAVPSASKHDLRYGPLDAAPADQRAQSLISCPAKLEHKHMPTQRRLSCWVLSGSCSIPYIRDSRQLPSAIIGLSGRLAWFAVCIGAVGADDAAADCVQAGRSLRCTVPQPTVRKASTGA